MARLIVMRGVDEGKQFDLSGSIIYAFGDLLPLPDPRVRFSAAIQRGGY